VPRLVSWSAVSGCATHSPRNGSLTTRRCNRRDGGVTTAAASRLGAQHESVCAFFLVGGGETEPQQFTNRRQTVAPRMRNLARRPGRAAAMELAYSRAGHCSYRSLTSESHTVSPVELWQTGTCTPEPKPSGTPGACARVIGFYSGGIVSSAGVEPRLSARCSTGPSSCSRNSAGAGLRRVDRRILLDQREQNGLALIL
jgi:hypothetical protein